MAERLGGKKNLAIQLPCGETPAAGQTLVIRRPGGVVSFGQVGPGAIANEAVTLAHAGVLRDIIFGGGYDGEADFDGVKTAGGVGPSANVYGLTRDISCARVFVRTGITVQTNGHKIFCRELHLFGTAIIHNDGSAGNNASGVTGGTAKTGNNSGTVGGSGSGGAGGNGDPAGADTGTAGAAGTAMTFSLGGAGGRGGTGVAGTSFPGQAGGVGGTTVSSSIGSTYALANLTQLLAGINYITGGAGGGGGGGGGSSATGAGGGGGGGAGGGGVLLVAADKIVLSAWTGRMSANGGQGGNSGTPGASAGAGGAGAGGGGGFVQVVYRELSGGALISGTNVTAAVGAFGAGNQTSAVSPVVGTVRLVSLAARFVPVAEMASEFYEEVDPTLDEYPYWEAESVFQRRS